MLDDTSGLNTGDLSVLWRHRDVTRTQPASVALGASRANVSCVKISSLFWKKWRKKRINWKKMYRFYCSWEPCCGCGNMSVRYREFCFFFGFLERAVWQTWKNVRSLEPRGRFDYCRMDGTIFFFFLHVFAWTNCGRQACWKENIPLVGGCRRWEKRFCLGKSQASKRFILIYCARMRIQTRYEGRKFLPQNDYSFPHWKWCFVISNFVKKEENNAMYEFI
jgi:hypothetical protein